MAMRFPLGRALWTIAAAFRLAASPAGAGSLEVAPTTILLQRDAGTGVLYVNNYGIVPVTVQIEAFDWSQSDGKDRLAPSDALMISPPIAAIPSQGKQTVRLMTSPPANAGERSFRLLISELPDATRHADHSVQVLTQFSVPVFTAGTAQPPAQIVWNAVLADGELELTARNEGAYHAKLTGLEFVAPGGDTHVLTGGGLNYILAGSSRSWNAPCAHCGVGDSIRIEGNDDVSAARLDNSLVIAR